MITLKWFGYNSFALENSQENINVKPRCSLLSGSEPIHNNTQSRPGAHLPSQLENLAWPVRRRADALVTVADGVTYYMTNHWVNRFIDIPYKML